MNTKPLAEEYFPALCVYKPGHAQSSFPWVFSNKEQADVWFAAHVQHDGGTVLWPWRMGHIPDAGKKVQP